MASANEAIKFYALFAERATSIEAAIDTRKIDECRDLIQETQALVSRNAPMLPARDIQTYNHRIEGYRKSFDAMRTPKKKFGFSRETRDAHEAKVKDSVCSGVSKDTSSGPSHGDTRSRPTFYLENESEKTLNLENVHGDVELKNLFKCEVRISGSPATLYMSDVNLCNIVCDPVANSILINGFVNSSLAVACQQLRVHKGNRVTFHLHVTSRSIIEDCTEILFGPLPENYPASEDAWSKSGLSRDTNNFNLVDDFNWLNAYEPSPNWKILDK